MTSAGTMAGGPPFGAMLAYFFAFFASALGYAGARIAELAGGALFAAGCYVIGRAAVERAAAPRADVFAAGLMLFGILNAGMVAAMRSGLGIFQAVPTPIRDLLSCRTGWG